MHHVGGFVGLDGQVEACHKHDPKRSGATGLVRSDLATVGADGDAITLTKRGQLLGSGPAALRG